MAEVLIQHKNIPASGRHAPHSFEYINETTRLEATNLVAADINKLALQLDAGTMWRLKGVNPIEWQSVGIDSWPQIKNKPAVFPPDLHTHTPDQVGTPAAISAAMTALKQEVDPFPQYATTAEVLDIANVKSVAGKIGDVTLSISDIGGLSTELSHKVDDDHLVDYANPHKVTQTQVGLDKVANLAPAELPISDATQAALDLKSDNTHTHDALEIAGAVRSVNGKYPNANGAVTIDVGGAAGDEFARFRKRNYFGIKLLES